MKLLNNKSKVSTVAFVLMLTIAATLTTFLSVAFAQLVRPTTAYLGFRPNPIGIDQTLLVNLWVVPFDTAGFDDFTVVFTDPDGITDTIVLDSYGDGTAWFLYVPDKLGTWKIKFTWAGQQIGNNIYEACESPELDLTVQQEPVLSWPPSDLPTDYWERPINVENREWYTIAGNWLMDRYNASIGGYNPYSTGPESAHILWEMQPSLGGIVGGEFGGASANYQRAPSARTAIHGLTFIELLDGVHCIDMRTGEVLWVKEGVPVSPGMFYYDYQAFHGRLLSIGDRLLMYEPFTGVLVLNVTGMSGDFDGTYVYSRSGGRMIKWDATGTTSNFANRIEWNVTDPGFRIRYVWGDAGGEIASPGSMSGAINLTDGSVLWNKTLPESDRQYSGGCAGYGKIIEPMLYTDAGEGAVYKCWNIYNGDELWTSEPSEYPWGSFPAYNAAAAYGMFYVRFYDAIYALNATTGKIVWRYSYTPEYPYENVYGNEYPWFSHGSGRGSVIADGKLYAANAEHTPSHPLTRGWRLHCIDAYEGKGIWNISFTLGDKQNMIIADGYLIGNNLYDSKIYCFGKGQTATTVSVSPAVVSKGSGVLIEGTVLDQSPAQPGTPCVSKESMTAWMEYLHMQKPCPMDVTGVPVDLRAISSDGSVIDIGTATSDVSGHFAKEWDPPDEDLYMITATFNGDESYWWSWAETGLSVDPEPTPYPAAPTEEEVADEVIGQLPDYTTMDLVIIVAVVVAICLVLYDIVTVRKLRK